MLIKIDNSVVANITSRSPGEQTQVIECLKFLALARREGKHIVIADRETLESIIFCFDDDNRTKEIFKKIREKEVSSLRSYLSVVSRYIEVCYPCLDVREIENLIPTSILAELQLNSSQEEALKLIELIDSSPVQQIKNFLDFKKRTLLSDIIKNKEDKVKSFWRDKILKIPNIQESLCQECHDKWDCQNDNCSCQISCGFGNKILDNVIQWSGNPHEISRKVTGSNLQLEWEKIGQKVINWCLAKDRINAL